MFCESRKPEFRRWLTQSFSVITQCLVQRCDNLNIPAARCDACNKDAECAVCHPGSIRAAAFAGMEKRILRRLSFINKRWSVAVTDTAPKEVRHSWHHLVALRVSGTNCLIKSRSYRNAEHGNFIPRITGIGLKEKDARSRQ